MPDWAYIRDLWRPLVEITILAVAIYYILIFVRGTRGWPVVIGFVVMLGLSFVLMRVFGVRELAVVGELFGSVRRRMLGR